MKSSRRSPLAELYMISVITMSVTASARERAAGTASVKKSAREMERRTFIGHILPLSFPEMRHPRRRFGGKRHCNTSRRWSLALRARLPDGSGARRDGRAAQVVSRGIGPAGPVRLLRGRASQELIEDQVDRVGEVEDAAIVDIGAFLALEQRSLSAEKGLEDDDRVAQVFPAIRGWV